MNTTDVELQALRDSRVRPKTYLSVAPRRYWASGLITDTHINYDAGGCFELEVSDIPGGDPNIVYGMTLDIGTAPGLDDVGRVRVRANSSTPVAGVAIWEIALTPQSYMFIEPGHYVTARNEFVLHQINYLLTPIYTDGAITDISENLDFDLQFGSPHYGESPKANITSGQDRNGRPIPVKLAEWEDYPGCGYRTIPLDSIFSRAMATGATIASVSWSYESGVIAVGVSTSGAILFRANVGFQYVRLEVVDSAGFHNWMRLPIWTHSPDYPPLSNFNITTDDTSDSRLQAYEFFGNEMVTVAQIPLKTELYCWETGAPNRPGSYRAGTRGWMYQAEPTFRTVDMRYTISSGGVAWWLDHFDGPSQALRDIHATPERWFDIDGITVQNGLWFALHNYSTAHHVVCIFFNNEITATTDRFNIPLGTGWQQLKDSAKRFWYCTIGADSSSEIFVEREFNHRQLSERYIIPPLLDLLSTDWPADQAVALTIKLYNEIRQLSGAGSFFNTDGKEVLFSSLAPSKAKVEGPAEGSFQGQYLPSVNPQFVLNALTGLEFGFSNGAIKSVPVTLLYDMDTVEPCWQYPVRINWVEDTIHGFKLMNALFTVDRVSVQYNYDSTKPYKEVTWTVSQVTYSGPGQTIPVVQEEGVSLPDELTCTTPDAHFTSTPSLCSVSFTDTSTGTHIIGRIWFFGDGTYSTALAPDHYYGAPGTYHVIYGIINACGELSVVTGDVVVSDDDESITAAFVKTGSGLTVTLEDESTADSGIASWYWDLGDGNTRPDQSPVYTFASPGTYPVTLTITSNCGATATVEHDVVITEATTPLTNVFPKAGQRVLAITNDGHARPTENFQDIFPTWGDFDLHTTIKPTGAVLYSAEVDPFSDQYTGLNGGVAVDIILMASNDDGHFKVYRMADVFNTAIITLIHSSLETSLIPFQLSLSRYQKGRYAVSYRKNAAQNQSKVEYTLDGGTTWANLRVQPDDGPDGLLQQEGGGITWLPDDTIDAVSQQWETHGMSSGAVQYIYRSIGGGAFSLLVASAEDGVSLLFRPQSARDILFEGASYKDGVSIQATSAITGNPINGVPSIHPANSSLIYQTGSSQDTSFAVSETLYSTDEGETWTSTSSVDSDDHLQYNKCALTEDDDIDVGAYVWGEQMVGYTDDYTVAPINKCTFGDKLVLGIAVAP